MLTYSAHVSNILLKHKAEGIVVFHKRYKTITSQQWRGEKRKRRSKKAANVKSVVYPPSRRITGVTIFG